MLTYIIFLMTAWKKITKIQDIKHFFEVQTKTTYLLVGLGGKFHFFTTLFLVVSDIISTTLCSPNSLLRSGNMALLLQYKKCKKCVVR